MYESHYTPDTIGYHCQKCGNLIVDRNNVPIKEYLEHCSVCAQIRDIEDRAFEMHQLRSEDSITESNPWIAFYSHLMGECRELGIKPWGDGHPATWASAQYHARKQHEANENEGILDEVDPNEIPHTLIAVEHGIDAIYARPVEEIELDVYQTPNFKVASCKWRRRDYRLDSKFHVPPYQWAEVKSRNRHGQVTGWRVQMAA